MKQFLDFLPLVVFFAFYKIYDIYAATAALIVATAIVLIYSWVRFRKVCLLYTSPSPRDTR